MGSPLLGPLSILTTLLLLGHQPAHTQQPRAEHRKVPLWPATAAPPDGVWGAWGPWSACSRSCSGGVMERTRPCLPGPTAQPPEAPHPLSGHVLSALRPSVPLLRTPARPGSAAQGHRLQALEERRSRTPGPIGPGSYGYGKAPYILPLQTDVAALPHGARRRISPSRPQGPARRATQTSALSLPSGPGLFNGPPRPHAVSCVGTYRQHKLCNMQVCPGSRSAREVQCASHNSQPFLGRFYQWEPFAEVNGPRGCELNCRASGYRFYVRQAERVIDGTPCSPDGSAVCVTGRCQSVGCDHFLGSDKVLDKCGVCGGDNTGCRVVSGVFQQALPSLGYHRVLGIPPGATRINVTEMRKSGNYLALRSRSGRSIINGNWAIDRPGRYEGAGTTFTYKRPNEISSTAGESFLADGPTTEALDVYMIHQQPNPGVHYEYVLLGPDASGPEGPHPPRPGEPLHSQQVPGRRRQEEPGEQQGSQEAAPNTQPSAGHPDGTDDSGYPARAPRRGREHNWKRLGSTACSISCGKGSQMPVFHCVHRLSQEEVPDSYCDPSTRPRPQEEPCNLFPCPAYWDLGEWSECSRSCGLGMQQRQVLCRQTFANRSLTVAPELCQHLGRPGTSSTCQLQICGEWQVRSDWTSCSVPCGVGQRTREVRCVSNLGELAQDEDCNLQLRPPHAENCDMGPCARSWFLGAWSQRCSAECGPGVRTRAVVCVAGPAGRLPLEGCGSPRPADTTPCDGGPCRGQAAWFAGDWSQCSVECGNGTQQREVICGRRRGAAFQVLEPQDCAPRLQPPTQQPCQQPPCGATWFSTEWSTCSKTCQGGFRLREVRCLSPSLALSSLCDPRLQPRDREACNPQDCIPEVDQHCQDKHFNCQLVLQARLCVYNYYRSACCASCSRAAPRRPPPP